MPQNRPLTAVVCDDRPEVRRTVTGVLARCGYVLLGKADDFAALRRLVRDERPAVIVLALPVMGSSSLAAVATLRSEGPGCSVVILSAFEQLELAAMEAGAAALVPETDPQALQAVLRAIAGGRAQGAPPAPRNESHASALSASPAPDASSAVRM